MQQFLALFNFNPDHAFKVGVERECFLTKNGQIVPMAFEVLSRLKASVNGRSHCYGYELSACQLEERTSGPVILSEVEAELERNHEEITAILEPLGLKRLFCGAAPFDVPLDVYPDKRYQRITSDQSVEFIRAACRVAGVHILVGMPDAQTALRVYNQVIRYLPELFELGATPERIEIYRRAVLKSERIQLFEDYLVETSIPPAYASWQDFYHRAVADGFDSDPRRLWDFIRISKHGAIEFRTFDTTQSIQQVQDWAHYCWQLCLNAA